MKLEHAKQIVEWLEDDGTEASVYEDYSGRGMYGDTTAGVVSAKVTDIAYAMGRLGLPHGFRTDNMGMDVIVY